MKSHTAAHVISTIINRETGALITGNQLYENKFRVDFNLETLTRIYS
jgi:misacylated tRNA(Ala) deacylase